MFEPRVQLVSPIRPPAQAGFATTTPNSSSRRHMSATGYSAANASRRSQLIGYEKTPSMAFLEQTVMQYEAALRMPSAAAEEKTVMSNSAA